MTTPMPPSPPIPAIGPAGPPLPPPPDMEDWRWTPPEEPQEGLGPNGREAPVEPDLEPEPQAASQAPHRIRLVFQSQQGVERGALLRLARWMGLDVWGDHLLNRRAAREMGSAALLLAVVLAFELLAWSMLFNVLVHSAQWTVGPRTILAVLLGGIFAAAVFLFEKSFVTADASEERWRISIAYAIRLVVILGSAAATAQPIELLVFGGAIENRLYEENVLAEAVRQVGNFEDRQTKAQGKKEADIQKEFIGSDEHESLNATWERRDEADQKTVELARQQTEAEEKLAAATKSEGYWSGELARRRRTRRASDPNGEAWVRSAQKSLAAASQGKATAGANLEDVKQKLREAQNRLTMLETRLTRDQKRWDDRIGARREQEAKETQRNQGLLEGIQDCMRFVQNARPGEVDPVTKCSLQPRPADFTERLIVLDDLRNARPPLWPATTQDKRERAAKLFGVSDFKGPSSPALEEAQGRMKQKAGIFQAIYRVAFIMALVIPLLTVAFKILMAGELRAYYSTLAQARAGNPAAIEVVFARGQQVWSDRGEDSGPGRRS